MHVNFQSILTSLLQHIEILNMINHKTSKQILAFFVLL